MWSAPYARPATPSRPSAICCRSPKTTCVALTNAGAYGAVMSSTYNSRLLVPEVLVADDRFAVIRPRPSFEAMLGMDVVPEWLDAPGGPAELPAKPSSRRGDAC